MKRTLFVALAAIALLVLAASALAAPLRQDPVPLIAQPESDVAVRGTVQVVGSATHPQFQRYELYYAPYPVPSDQSWIFIGDAKFNQQPLGLLGTWDSRAVPDGTYALRVRVVKQDGNYLDSDARRVLVANTRPVASPTSEATETPEEEPTPLPTADVQATATVVVSVPAVESPTPEPTATPEAATTALLPRTTPAAGSNGDAASADSLLSGSRLFAVARKAVLYTVGAFAAVMAFFALKALLAWLWHRARP